MKAEAQSSIKREPVIPTSSSIRSRVDSSDEEQRPTIKREPLPSASAGRSSASSARARVDADSDEETETRVPQPPQSRSTATHSKVRDTPSTQSARSRVDDDSDKEPARALPPHSTTALQKAATARSRIDNDSDEEPPTASAAAATVKTEPLTAFKKRSGLMSRQEVSEDLRAAHKQETDIVDLTLIGIPFHLKIFHFILVFNF